MSTLLSDLVRKQTSYGVIGIFSKAIDKVAEEMAQDLLRDPVFRAELQELVRVAFQQALKDLNEPAPPAEEQLPRHRLQQLDRIEDLLREIPKRSLDVRGTTGGKATTEIVKP